MLTDTDTFRRKARLCKVIGTVYAVAKNTINIQIPSFVLHVQETVERVNKALFQIFQKQIIFVHLLNENLYIYQSI